MSTANQQDKLLTLKDGRKLGFRIYGSPKGQAVFYFHGSGSSRLEHPTPENLLDRLNVRFIGVDRPGNGLSDFQPNRHLLNWAEDISLLADHLEIEQFYVAGHSAGGPHALVCGHQLPKRVRAVAAISSPAPMHRPNAYRGMPLMNQILARSARNFPALVRLIRWIMRSMIMGDAEKASRQLMAAIPDTDKQTLYNPQSIETFVAAVREGFRSGSRGVAQDDILINQEWGFDLEAIEPRVDIWHGEEDVNVPVSAARYLCSRLPDARVHILPGQGHFFIMKYWEKIISALVAER